MPERWNAHLVSLIGLCLILVACGDGGTTANTALNVAPSAVGWCDEPIIGFSDGGVTPNRTLTTWDDAKGLLGFDPLLPPKVPSGACLFSAGGVVRNPLFGGRFTITYQIPGSGSISLAEVPSQQDIPTPQCDDSGTSTRLSITTCQQTLSGLNVTISSSETADQIRAMLAALRPGIAWVPING